MHHPPTHTSIEVIYFRISQLLLPRIGRGPTIQKQEDNFLEWMFSCAAAIILPLFKMVKKIAQSCRCSGLSRWEEAIAKSCLYATFVKTVTATRSLERMFPIHALYPLITGPAIQPALQWRVRCTICISLYNTAYTTRTLHPSYFWPEGQTRHIYLWYGKRASNAECDKLWRKSCICIAAKWVEQHASSHATPPFYWTLLLLSSPLSHLLILLPHFSLDFAAILTNSLSFHLFCSFVRFQKPCKPIFVGLCHSPTMSVATQVKILLPLRIQQQEKEKNTGATTFVEKSE